MEKNSSVRCKRCHRLLKDVKAMSRGYGNCCWKKHLQEERTQNNLFTINQKEIRTL